MTESEGALEFLLPVDVSVATPRPLAATAHDKPPTPPGYGEVVDGVAPENDPDKWFTMAERATAEWLRNRGVDVRSVERREGHLLKTPDAIAGSAPITVEFKGAIGSVNSIVQRIRQGRWQARHVVVDVRNTGTTRATAEDAVRRALVKYQADLDEVIIIVANDLSVGWTRG